jgi:hypothetical protein
MPDEPTPYDIVRKRAAKRAQDIDAKDQEAKKRQPHGGDRRKVYNKRNDVHLVPRGNTAAAALRRLRKDRPDIHGRVLAGELSPHAGMVEAGFRRPAHRG